MLGSAGFSKSAGNYYTRHVSTLWKFFEKFGERQ